MRRRTYLTAIALTTSAGLAGCTGEGGGNESGNESGEGEGTGGTENEESTPPTEETETETRTETEAETETETETETAESEGEPDIQTSPGELSVDESGYSPETYVPVEVTNEGEGASGRITLAAEWYDENGDYLNSSNEYLQTLTVGETWLARIDAVTDDEEIDDYKLTTEIEEEPPQPPADVELLESELQTGEDEVSVTGRVENNTGDDLGYIEAIARVYDNEKRVLADEYTNETGLPEGETWRFSIDRLVRYRIDEVGDHDVLLSS